MRFVITGSPPRVRGTVQSKLCSIILARITPAGAGNSSWQAVYSFDVRDHPRGCGEQPSTIKKPDCELGSPPRVRGTAMNLVINSRNERITPAGAGNRTSVP